MPNTDVCIVGAGPAGTTAAMRLAKMGIPSILVDKAAFPRPKTCGEAMRANVFIALRKLNEAYPQRLLSNDTLTTFSHVEIFGRDQRSASINFGNSVNYTGKRELLDRFLFEEACRQEAIRVVPQLPISEIRREGNGFVLSNKQGREPIKSRLLILATGGSAALHHQLHPRYARKHVVGVRAYFNRVNIQPGKTHIFFLDHLKGGYLWVFPLPGGMANVGLTYKGHDKVNYKAVFHQSIAHPHVRPLLDGAEMDGLISAAKLTLPKWKQAISGPGYMLVGDSGLAINPISGMGVGHAMLMGHYAAETAAQIIRRQDYSLPAFRAYDRLVYQKLGMEVMGGLILTALVNRPKVVDRLIRLVGGNAGLQQMFLRHDFTSQMYRPGFWLKHLLFSKSAAAHTAKAAEFSEQKIGFDGQ